MTTDASRRLNCPCQQGSLSIHKHMCCLSTAKCSFFQESILNLNCLSVKLVQSGFILITAAIGSCWWVREDVLLLEAEEEMFAELLPIKHCSVFQHHHKSENGGQQWALVPVPVGFSSGPQPGLRECCLLLMETMESESWTLGRLPCSTCSSFYQSRHVENTDRLDQ